jgi:outer membrane immunogenic protein
MKTRIGVAAIAALIVTRAFAADMPLKAPPPPPAPVYSWNGFYVGGNAGWVGSVGNTIDFTGTDSGTAGLGSALASGAIPGSTDLGYSGILGGGQVGYNWQTNNNWVLGVEFDLDAVGASNSTSFPDARLINPTGGMNSPFTISVARELTWLGTLRGRIGITPTAPFLLYATGGLAFAQHAVGVGVTDPTAVPPESLFSEPLGWSAGWTVGMGAEWMFAQHWSVKAEYLYVDLGNISSTINYAYTVTPPGTPETSSLTATVHDRDNLVRGGINYHF